MSKRTQTGLACHDCAHFKSAICNDDGDIENDCRVRNDVQTLRSWPFYNTRCKLFVLRAWLDAKDKEAGR